jgi:hypothetical protein
MNTNNTDIDHDFYDIWERFISNLSDKELEDAIRTCKVYPHVIFWLLKEERFYRNNTTNTVIPEPG